MISFMGKIDNWNIQDFNFFIGPKCNRGRRYFWLKCCNNGVISDHFKVKLSKFFFAALASLAMYDHTTNVKNIRIMFLLALLIG